MNFETFIRNTFSNIIILKTNTKSFPIPQCYFLSVKMAEIASLIVEKTGTL